MHTSAKLPQDRAEYVLGITDTVFASYWEKNGLIHENIFDEVFEGENDIDALSNRIGKPLNELSTNRQRFMMDNHKGWTDEMARRKDQLMAVIAEKERKRLERAAAQAARPSKCRVCSHPECGNYIDITTSVLKKTNEALWKRCPGKRCSMWGCHDHFEMITCHCKNCYKVVDEDENYKAT